MRTNPPRMITVLVAVALLAVGLALTLVPVEAVGDAVGTALRDADLDYGAEEVGWAALLASNVLLLAGSVLKGV